MSGVETLVFIFVFCYVYTWLFAGMEFYFSKKEIQVKDIFNAVWIYGIICCFYTPIHIAMKVCEAWDWLSEIKIRGGKR